MNPLGILNARFGTVAEEDLDTLRTGGSVLVQINGVETEAEPPVHIWECGCFKIDRDFAMYVVQTTVGCLLIVFSCVRLAVEQNADKSAPYWGLVGTMCGFIFMKTKDERKRKSATAQPIK